MPNKERDTGAGAMSSVQIPVARGRVASVSGTSGGSFGMKMHLADGDVGGILKCMWRLSTAFHTGIQKPFRQTAHRQKPLQTQFLKTCNK